MDSSVQDNPAAPSLFLEAGVLVRKLRQLLPRSAKLSGLTPGVSYCSVESAVSLACCVHQPIVTSESMIVG
jgi:hypothetical protein